MIFRRAPAVFALLLTFAGCDGAPQGGAVSISVVGDKSGLIASATAQGLVAFDADGQIEPALAERWIVSDDGLSLAFRLARANWSNGRPIAATDVARSLKDSFARAPTTRLGRLFNAVEDVVPMTERVVEIRLKEPRPNLLQLLAQPEFSVRHLGNGGGPYKMQSARSGILTLRPLKAPDGSDDKLTDNDWHAREIQIRNEGAALSMVHFQSGHTQAVLGGSFVDYPVARAAQINPSQMVVDPVRGLFGLAFVSQNALTADPALRQALDMAIDRSSLARALNLPGWQVRETVLPSVLDINAAPAAADWSGTTIAIRRGEASKRIRDWITYHKASPIVRVALPDGPGARLLFARLATDWRAIGLDARLVGLRDAADLRLIDEVAPSGSVNWYFTRLSCAAGLICDKDADDALNAARNAESLDARAQAYVMVDRSLATHTPFITLGNPYRWSFASPQIPGLRPTSFGVHPLSHMSATPN